MEKLGIDVIWLSPIYQSPNDDNGYDISDYRAIMSEFGTLEEFKLLLEEAHACGIKIVMDLVVNHSSDEHAWFVESKKSKENPYRDYYIWKEPRDGREPNNWQSCFGGSAWQYDESTQMYYLHMFSKKQPDLNWENETLRQEVYDMMKWWGDIGIDGFRMDVITMISKVQSYPDGELVPNTPYGNFGPYVQNGPRVHEFLQEMNQEVISKYDWLTVGEGAGAKVEDAIHYANYDDTELNMVFTFEHVDIGQTVYGKWSDGKVDLVEFKKVMTKWQVGLEGKAWNSLYLSNHDQPRCVSRFGNDNEAYREISAKMLATCMHFMKGTPYIYQGEELGMTNRICKDFSIFQDIEIKNAYRDYVETGVLKEEEMLGFVNAIGRDNARFPMQWDGSEYAGFSKSEPWIEVNPNYETINAMSQIDDLDSVFHYYKRLVELRHSNDIMVYGVYKLYDEENAQVYLYSRELDGKKLWCVCNFTDTEIDYELPSEFEGGNTVLITNYSDCIRNENHLTLRPYEAKVFCE